MELLRFKPQHVWTLDTTSPFADKSGYATNATLTGTSTKAIALSRHAAYSQVVNSTNYITFPQTLYIRGFETREFSLMASAFLPDTGGTGDQQILSNLGRADGLSINGNIVSFSTAYTSNGSATCSYQLPLNEKVDVVGVHTKSQNMLYVNGEMVDYVDITAAQQADTYATTDGNLYAGRLNTENLLINQVAIFPDALHDDEIVAIYNDNNYTSVTDPAYAYSGELIDVTGTSRPPYLNTQWNDEDDWSEGTWQAVWVDDNGYMRPEMVGAVTMAGVWTNSVNLYAGGVPTAINSIYLWWDGKNVTVDTSVDGGTTWVTATRGVNLSNVTTGFDPTNLTLMIRATFTANVSEAYLGQMRAVGYLTNTQQQPNGRVITYTNPVTTLYDQIPAQLREDWGAKSQGGTISIATDTTSDTPMSVLTVGIWLKQLTATAPTFSTNLTTSTTEYVNGLAGSTLRRGEWNLVYFTKASAITGAITISGNVQVGRVVVYSTQLSATQVANLAANYTGRLIATRASGGPVTIFEPASPANIYSHDWANV